MHALIQTKTIIRILFFRLNHPKEKNEVSQVFDETVTRNSDH